MLCFLHLPSRASPTNPLADLQPFPQSQIVASGIMAQLVPALAAGTAVLLAAKLRKATLDERDLASALDEVGGCAGGAGQGR